MIDQKDTTKGKPNPEKGQNLVVNEPRATISDNSDGRSGPGKKKRCLGCSKGFKPVVAKQEFCSGRCRLLYWAAKEIVKELNNNENTGIRKVLKDYFL